MTGMETLSQTTDTEVHANVSDRPEKSEEPTELREIVGNDAFLDLRDFSLRIEGGRNEIEPSLQS